MDGWMDVKSSYFFGLENSYRNRHMHTHTGTHTHALTHTHKLTHTRTHSHSHTHTYTHVHTYTYVYKYTNTQHTCTHQTHAYSNGKKIFTADERLTEAVKVCTGAC